MPVLGGAGRPTTDARAFNENLTTSSLPESDVCIGDVFRLGGARVQVSQPCQPCNKLAGRFNHRELPEEIYATGFSGFHVRVLDEGLVHAGDLIELLECDLVGGNGAVHQRAALPEVDRFRGLRAHAGPWRRSSKQATLRCSSGWP
ncbi:MAG: MOSC domain-containing protein [Anaerolineales bacterium]|nr:MOSC domain-containing protein [Anaerolineales bacterium]